ncbi:MAG: hypothetical protein PHV06_03625, partial [bacterium]|nr:hypothetical protein [bacterium]
MKKGLTAFLIIVTLLLFCFGDKAGDALKQGEELIKKGEVNKAILEFRRAISVDPKSKTAERAQYLIAVYTTDVFTKILEFKNLIENRS